MIEPYRTIPRTWTQTSPKLPCIVFSPPQNPDRLSAAAVLPYFSLEHPRQGLSQFHAIFDLQQTGCIPRQPCCAVLRYSHANHSLAGVGSHLLECLLVLHPLVSCCDTQGIGTGQTSGRDPLILQKDGLVYHAALHAFQAPEYRFASKQMIQEEKYLLDQLHSKGNLLGIFGKGCRA